MFFNFPSTILFGKEHILEMVNNVCCKKLAVITGKSGKRLENAIIQELFLLLKNMGVELTICKCAEPNPTYDNVCDAIEAIKNNNCEKVLAVGGGSAIDVAKVAAYGVKNELDFWQYIENPELCTNMSLPIFVINTTAGTGSEINCCAVVTKENRKMALVCNSIYPKVTLIIPELMNTLSLENTIVQTLDCIYHASEAYLSKNANNFSRLCSVNCIEMCLCGLKELSCNNQSIEARAKLALASIYSGMADTYGGCLSIHSLGHAISAFSPKVTHGISITAIAPAYYEKMLENGSDIVKTRQHELCAIFNRHTDISETKSFGKVLANFYKKVGFDGISLSNIGFFETDFEKLVINARETVGILFENDAVDFTNDMLIDILNSSR